MKAKRYYLEALRVLAMLLVMFNHSPAYLSLEGRGVTGYVSSMACSMVCKCAVPLFFMISGAVLLGKNESLSELYRKRIARMILVLVLISLLFYLKMVFRGDIAFSFPGFINLMLTDVLFLPYWYLYAYLGFLAILPFLRAMAQHLTREHIVYLVILQLAFKVVFYGIEGVTGWHFSGYLLDSLEVMFAIVVFYPLVGYGLDCLMKEDEGHGRELILCNLLLAATIVVTGILVHQDYLKTGAYRELYLGFGTSIAAITLFLDCRALFGRESVPEPAKKVLVFLGDKVFGIYLLEGFIGLNGKMDVIYRFLSPYLGFMLAYFVEILAVFCLRLGLVTVAKRLPVLRGLL